MTIVTADLYDQHHGTIAVCERQFRSFGRRQAFFGPCSTLKTFEDHTPVLAALSEAGNGRVLVVDGESSLRVGLMGDRLAAIGAANGWVGLVIDGAIRDSLGIEQLTIGVKALGTTARRGWIPGAGQRDVPLLIGGVTFSPGDWVYADVDCVLVSPHELDLRTSPAPLTASEPHA
jgi:regulator of ribonuclease activity A